MITTKRIADNEKYREETIPPPISFVTEVANEVWCKIATFLKPADFWNLRRTCKGLYSNLNIDNFERKVRKVLYSAKQFSHYVLNIKEHKYQVLDNIKCPSGTLDQGYYNQCGMIQVSDKVFNDGPGNYTITDRKLKYLDNKPPPRDINYHYYNEELTFKVNLLGEKTISYEGYEITKRRDLKVIIKENNEVVKEISNVDGKLRDITVSHEHLLAISPEGLHVYNLKSLEHFVLPSIKGSHIASLNNGENFAVNDQYTGLTLYSWEGNDLKVNIRDEYPILDKVLTLKTKISYFAENLFKSRNNEESGCC